MIVTLRLGSLWEKHHRTVHGAGWQFKVGDDLCRRANSFHHKRVGKRFSFFELSRTGFDKRILPTTVEIRQLPFCHCSYAASINRTAGGPNIYNHICNKGMSSSSRREHRNSPNKIIMMVPKIWQIHQSQVAGMPLYQVQSSKCTKNNVTLKSKHFFDFSTIMANNTALVINNKNTNNVEAKIRSKRRIVWMIKRAWDKAFFNIPSMVDHRIARASSIIQYKVILLRTQTHWRGEWQHYRPNFVTNTSVGTCRWRCDQW